MTRKDAEQIIARIRADEISLQQSRHARQQFSARTYSPHDLRAILDSHEMEAPPEWIEAHQNFKGVFARQLLGGQAHPGRSWSP